MILIRMEDCLREAVSFQIFKQCQILKPTFGGPHMRF